MHASCIQIPDTTGSSRHPNLEPWESRLVPAAQGLLEPLKPSSGAAIGARVKTPYKGIVQGSSRVLVKALPGSL